MQQRIGPYRVEERLGTGGMGEVYKAYDDRLERWVAIKRIRSDRDEGAENRERFQREARATARLNHNSIVHLYDIFQDGESDCIVMEYVEGMTLDKLIRNGPLEPLQVASLGHEIATGLAEAHAKGIIHRDLKVENVIVTPKGHAKILDFGLARPLLKSELDTSLTGKGQLVGTSRTMSPEYVSGEDIDHRSDLFSLGVLLYEAVTSHSPFKAHNTLATLKQVMLHHQTPAHLVSSHVPEELSTVIESLLEKDPDDRPQSAEEVAHEFGLIAGRLSSGNVDRPPISSSFTPTPTEVFTPTPTAVDMWVRRRSPSSIVALLLVGIAVTFFLTRWLTSEPNRPVTPNGGVSQPGETRDRIVLADFQNLTSEPLLDSIELAFRLSFEQSRLVLPRSQMQGALARMQKDAGAKIDRELGMEICQREGARALVIGSIVKIGETYSLSAEIIDPKDGVNTFSAQENVVGKNAIVDALDSLSRQLRLNLGESLANIEKSQPLEKVTTGDLEALKAYSLGATKSQEGKIEEAIRLLERALEVDPEFAMAHAKLASIYINFAIDRDKTLFHLNEARRLKDRLTEVETLYVEGWVARLHGNPREIIDAWSLMTSLYPNEFVGQFNLGMARLTYLEQYGEAAKAFQAAVRVAAPEYLSSALISLGYCQMALGQYEEARVNFENAAGPDAEVALARLHIAKEDYPAACLLLQESLHELSRFAQFRARLVLAECQASEGRLDEALREAREAIRLVRGEGAELRLMSLLTLASVQERLGAATELDQTLGSAIELISSHGEIVSREDGPAPLTIQTQALFAKLSARNGDVAGAETLRDLLSVQLNEATPAAWQAYAEVVEGEILAAHGDLSGAVNRLRNAVALSGSFQAHESLARALRAAEQPEAAITEYQWLLDHRGQGLVECYELCHGLSTIDWALAALHLARLYEKLGQPEDAVQAYRKFLQIWRGGDELEVWQQATHNLTSLTSAGAGSTR